MAIAAHNNQSLERGHILAHLFLAVTVVIQSISMARVGLPRSEDARDAYGSYICSTHGAKLPVHDDIDTACCVNGCLFSTTLVAHSSNKSLLTLAMRQGNTLPLIKFSALWLRTYWLSHDARAPPLKWLLV